MGVSGDERRHAERRTMALRGPGAGGYTPPQSLSASNPCLNCGTNVQLTFCPECGQQEIDSDPTLRELVRELAEEFFRWDGKLFSTFRLLGTQPGELTREYFAGRRVRFISPVKLYLVCSALFFFVNAVTPSAPSRSRATGKANGGFIEAISTALLEKPVALNAPATAADRRLLDTRSRWLARVRQDPRGFEQKVQSVVPQAMFVLLPVIALLLAITFRRARVHYPQHLVFMLHVQSFFYLTLTAYDAVAWLPWRRLSGVLLLAALAANFGYLLAAAGRVYRCGTASTVARAAIFTAGYLLLWLLVLSATVGIVAATY
ncbi:MAG: DUF3667 domain-containing protein [bacterium]